MRRNLSKFVCLGLLIGLILFFSFTKTAEAKIILLNQNIKLSAGHTVFWQFTFKKGDNLVLNISANGGINVYVRDAFGGTWYLGNDTPYVRSRFIVPHNGIYRLYIDNSHSFITDKYVHVIAYYISVQELGQFLRYLSSKMQGYLHKLSNYNSNINLPQLVYRNCGEANAYYMPVTNTITICNELVWRVIDFEMLQDINNWEKRAVNVLAFTLFHELGHALIHLCRLPVLGKEEDAADALATLAAIEFDPEMAYEGAVAFLTILNSRIPIYWDSHSPSEERFYNILCWLYGSNPRVFFFIGRVYPELTSRHCEYEYQQLNNSWKQLLRKCGFRF